MKRVVPWLVASGLALAPSGCSAPPPDPGDDPQAAALRRLESDTGVAWTVRWRSDDHTPAVLAGRTPPVVDRVSAAEAAALDFLGSYRSIFQMDDPSDVLLLEGADGDELGMTHARFNQVQGGVPVWGAGLHVHFDASGALVRVEGRYVPLASPGALDPIVRADEAAKEAESSATASGLIAPSSLVAAESPSLVVDPRWAPSGRLAWRVELRVDHPVRPARIESFVDALTADVYRSRNVLARLQGAGTGVFGEPQQFEIVARSNRFYMEDSTVGRPPQTIHSANGESRLPGAVVSSTRVDRWDQDVARGAGAAVDAQVYVAAAHDYFARRHGRAGALGTGAGMRATVHYGAALADAFWNGHELVFGDGDGGEIAPLAGALDVVAHEFTHAVSERSARLLRDGQSGSLDEAVADVFGCFVELAVRGDAGNWILGEDLIRHGPRPGLRDLADPRRTGNPAHLSQQIESADGSTTLETNSTIASHAAFLMTEGGTNPVSGISVEGIGREASERVWYRALVRYLGPSSDFLDAADATAAAAEDLFGSDSAIVRSVRRAWLSVGIRASEPP
jgi:thermolysin